MLGKGEKLGVALRVGFRLIVERMAIRLGGFASHIRLHEEMCLRLRDKAKHGRKRPRQDAGLTARQRRENPAPAIEPRGECTVAMQEIVKPLGEGFGARLRLDRIAHGHLLEREKEISARLDGDRVPRDANEIAARKTIRKSRRAETLLPLLMGAPFIIALPIDIGRIGKTAREHTEEFPPRLDGAGGDYRPLWLGCGGKLGTALSVGRDSRSERDLPFVRRDVGFLRGHLSPTRRQQAQPFGPLRTAP